MPPSSHPFVWTLWEIVNLEFMIKFAVFYFFLIWFCLILWVLKDISERTGSLLYRTIALMLITFWTPLGIILYLLIRPRKISEKKFLHEIEENLWILEEIIAEKVRDNHNEAEIYCPHCGDIIEEEFALCPGCKTSLKSECVSCHKEIKPDWKVCPYCMSKQKKKKK